MLVDNGTIVDVSTGPAANNSAGTSVTNGPIRFPELQGRFRFQLGDDEYTQGVFDNVYFSICFDEKSEPPEFSPDDFQVSIIEGDGYLIDTPWKGGNGLFEDFYCYTGGWYEPTLGGPTVFHESVFNLTATRWTMSKTHLCRKCKLLHYSNSVVIM